MDGRYQYTVKLTLKDDEKTSVFSQSPTQIVHYAVEFEPFFSYEEVKPDWSKIEHSFSLFTRKKDQFFEMLEKILIDCDFATCTILKRRIIALICNFFLSTYSPPKKRDNFPFLDFYQKIDDSLIYSFLIVQLSSLDRITDPKKIPYPKFDRKPEYKLNQEEIKSIVRFYNTCVKTKEQKISKFVHSIAFHPLLEGELKGIDEDLDLDIIRKRLDVSQFLDSDHYYFDCFKPIFRLGDEELILNPCKNWCIDESSDADSIPLDENTKISKKKIIERIVSKHLQQQDYNIKISNGEQKLTKFFHNLSTLSDTKHNVCQPFCITPTTSKYLLEPSPIWQLTSIPVSPIISLALSKSSNALWFSKIVAEEDKDQTQQNNTESSQQEKKLPKELAVFGKCISSPLAQIPFSNQDIWKFITYNNKYPFFISLVNHFILPKSNQYNNVTHPFEEFTQLLTNVTFLTPNIKPPNWFKYQQTSEEKQKEIAGLVEYISELFKVPKNSSSYFQIIGAVTNIFQNSIPVDTSGNLIKQVYSSNFETDKRKVAVAEKLKALTQNQNIEIPTTEKPPEGSQPSKTNNNDKSLTTDICQFVAVI